LLFIFKDIENKNGAIGEVGKSWDQKGAFIVKFS